MKLSHLKWSKLGQNYEWKAPDNNYCSQTVSVENNHRSSSYNLRYVRTFRLLYSRYWVDNLTKTLKGNSDHFFWLFETKEIYQYLFRFRVRAKIRNATWEQESAQNIFYSSIDFIRPDSNYLFISQQTKLLSIF